MKLFKQNEFLREPTKLNADPNNQPTNPLHSFVTEGKEEVMGWLPASEKKRRSMIKGYQGRWLREKSLDLPDDDDDDGSFSFRGSRGIKVARVSRFIATRRPRPPRRPGSFVARNRLDSVEKRVQSAWAMKNQRKNETSRRGTLMSRSLLLYRTYVSTTTLCVYMFFYSHLQLQCV